jgi:hypothetical protein
MPHRAKIALITRAATRSVAIFAAALTLAGQLAAVAHFHPAPDRDSINAVSRLSADDGACALCLLAFHTSANPRATQSVATPTMSTLSAVAPVAGVFHRIDSPSALTRAPPPAA